jgi:hypothetical protein
MRTLPIKLFFVLLLSCFISEAVLAESFNRISSFSTDANIPASMEKSKTESSAEIITVSADGMTLIYSDSPLGGIGLIDISDPKNPKPAGFIKMDGEPTSVAIAGKTILTGVNTSKNYTSPSGYLAAVSIDTKKTVKTCDLGGQPDSVAVSPDGNYVAIAIENERDEDLNDGVIPQLPAGNLTIFKLKEGMPDCNSKMVVDLTGLADIAGSDPEPEYVDFNNNNEIVVSLQENNYFAIVNAGTGKVTSHFSAGAVNLSNVDLDEEGALTFDGTQNNRKREPDTIKWIDNDRFVAANEGDYEGGSRGFTIYSKTGQVLYESNLDLEYRIAMAGHYPEKRSGNKGAEPEGLEVARFGDKTYIFVMSERGSAIGVYQDVKNTPQFIQLLPSGIGPESAVAIPSRNLLASANETDLSQENGPRAHVMIYELAAAKPEYPQIESVMKDGRPIGWGALSGLVADPEQPGIMYAVNDSFYRSQPTIFTIDAKSTPARIIKATPVTRDGFPAQKMDIEGITTDGKGGFWLASEGRTDRLTPHALYHVNARGEILSKNGEFAFPPELLAVEKRFGSEGVTRIDDTLWIAIQRQWKDDLKNTVKLVAYNLKTKEWGAVRYPTEAADKGWVGLSEITAFGEYVYIIERDNQIGDKAKIKRLYRVAKSQLKPAKLGSELPMVEKELVHDFIPDLKALNGYVVDKIEGFAIDANGVGYAVTDNDGVDDSSGETYFFSIGKIK